VNKYTNAKINKMMVMKKYYEHVTHISVKGTACDQNEVWEVLHGQACTRMPKLEHVLASHASAPKYLTT
jgi:hypothetical protein